MTPFSFPKLFPSVKTLSRIPFRRPPIVCLCGSTRFKQEFITANFRLTLGGIIVLTVGWFSHVDKDVYELSMEEKAKMDVLHLHKINCSDGVFVICPGDYIGESTTREIAYAESLDKPVVYWRGEEDL